MKKIILGICIFVLLGGYVYRVKSVNENYPNDIKLVEYKTGDKIELNNSIITFKNYRLEDDKNNPGYKLLVANIELENKTEKELNLYDDVANLIYFQNFQDSVIQNIEEPGFANRFYEKGYKIEKDFTLKPKDKKEYEFIYMTNGDIKNSFNAILLDNSFYKDEYKKEFDKGILLYKLIKIGENNDKRISYKSI